MKKNENLISGEDEQINTSRTREFVIPNDSSGDNFKNNKIINSISSSSGFSSLSFSSFFITM